MNVNKRKWICIGDIVHPHNDCLLQVSPHAQQKRYYSQRSIDFIYVDSSALSCATPLRSHPYVRSKMCQTFLSRSFAFSFISG